MKYPEILEINPEPVISSYTERDVILYALSIGMGADPENERELPFVYEKSLRAIPTMATNLDSAAHVIMEGGDLDMTRMVHGEQRLRMHRPLPPVASVKSQSRCLNVLDKGKDRGAVVNIESSFRDTATDELLATHIMSLFCRADGGFNGPNKGALPRHQVPDRPADHTVAVPTAPNQALLFRLNGDTNPLHCDPEFARSVGFEQPILHGMCTYGLACRALLKKFCDYDPALIKELDVCFSAPVYPGETLVFHFWCDGATVAFECSVAERPVTVLRNGRCLLAPGA